MNRREEAASLYRAGLTERQVAARMELSKSTVHTYLVDAGVRRRRRGRRRGHHHSRSTA